MIKQNNIWQDSFCWQLIFSATSLMLVGEFNNCNNNRCGGNCMTLSGKPRNDVSPLKKFLERHHRMSVPRTWHHKAVDSTPPCAPWTPSGCQVVPGHPMTNVWETDTGTRRAWGLIWQGFHVFLWLSKWRLRWFSLVDLSYWTFKLVLIIFRGREAMAWILWVIFAEGIFTSSSLLLQTSYSPLTMFSCPPGEAF